MPIKNKRALLRGASSRNRIKSHLKKIENAALIDAVWEKASPGRGIDGAQYRKDAFGSWIRKSSYGKRDDFGWEMDGPAKPGSRDASQWTPLHWKNKQLKAQGLFDFEETEISQGM